MNRVQKCVLLSAVLGPCIFFSCSKEDVSVKERVEQLSESERKQLYDDLHNQYSESNAKLKSDEVFKKAEHPCATFWATLPGKESKKSWTGHFPSSAL